MNPSQYSTNIEILNTFKLLAEGEDQIVLDERSKNITLILGNEQAGKTTFVQWLFGDSDKLISKDDGSGTFIIIDNETTTTKAQQLVPEFVLDEKTTAAYYDCASFSDTKTTSYDVGNAYFLKKLIDHAENLKIVLVVDYASVRQEVYQEDFLQLMRHSVELLRDFEKFHDSIAIAVTKVENKYEMVGTEFTLVSDERIMLSIATSLKAIKADVVSRLMDDDVSSDEYKFYTNTIKLIDILTMKDDGENYSKIGILRRPNKPGPLKEVTILEEGKLHFEKTVFKNLKFTDRKDKDFGYKVSARTNHDLDALGDVINTKVWTEVIGITDTIQMHFHDSLQSLHVEIDNFARNIFMTNSDDEVEAYKYSTRINTGYEVLANFTEELKEITDIEELAVKSENHLIELELNACEDNLERISVQGKYFTFMELIGDRKLATGPWEKLFERILTYLTINKNVIVNYIQKITERINFFTRGIARDIEDQYKVKMNELVIEKLPFELHNGLLGMRQMLHTSGNASCAQDLSRAINDGIENFDVDNFNIKRLAADILYHGKYLNFLNVLVDGSDTWTDEWLKPLDGASKYLNESEKWYVFLQSLYGELSKYEFQNNKSKYNVADISDWGSEGRMQGIEITKSNFKEFLQKIAQYGLNEYETVKEMLAVSDMQLSELNYVLGLTLNNGLYMQCRSGQLVILGDFAKLSDFVTTNGKIDASACKDGVRLSSVNIFALNRVFIDRNIQSVGEKVNVNVLAPHWEIVGVRELNLNGVAGDTRQSQATNGIWPGGIGKNGNPGAAGGAAGNFFGVGSSYVNTGNLYIYANGGQGGRGQDGGHGSDGKWGDNALRNENFERKFLRDDKIVAIFVNIVTEQWLYYGKHGTVGGNGGNGGASGLGGNKGDIKLLSTNGTLNWANIIKQNGAAGVYGIEGTGGKGGKRGNDLLAYKEIIYSIFTAWAPVSSWYNKEYYQVNTYASDGKSGQPNSNSVGRQQPEAETKFSIVTNILNDYKTFLRENTNDRFKQHALLQFQHQLDNNKDINKFYDTLALTQELRDVEQHYQTLKTLNTEDRLYFYEALLRRIEEYSKNPKTNERTLQYKKVLAYLYTAALSRIHNIKTASEPNLVVDINKYLDLVKQNAVSLLNLQETTTKIKVINHHRDSYKAGIDRKVKEAENLIKTQILPEIDNISAQVDLKVELLMNEVIYLQNQAIEDQKKLYEAKQKLQDSFVANMIFSGLKSFGKIIGSFVPMGGILNSVIDFASSVSTSMALGDNDALLDIPFKVLFDMEVLINELENEKEIQELHLHDIVEGGAAAVGIYKKYKSETQKLNVLNEAIAKKGAEIEKLLKYEEQIHEIMIPLLGTMIDGLKVTADELRGKSRVSLDVTKWKIQSSLKDMKLNVQKITNGFHVQDDLARYMEKLDEAMTTMIIIYDRIQNYHEQKDLADYIAAISSPIANGINVSDAQLSLAVNELEIMIRSNIVLDQYKTALNALTQNVFPFAHLYITNGYLPVHLEQEKDFQSIVTRAISQVESMKAKVEEYKATIKHHDKYTSSGWFNSNFVSTKPFYVWKNEDYRDIIAKLLSGKKVVVNSDIYTYGLYKDAIKFNLVEIELKTRNATIQPEMVEKLKGFRVSLTHLGNSYYRFDDKIYAITSDSQTIQFSFEKMENGEPLHKNTVYDKIRAGDLMLSPYSMWEIQLQNSTNQIHFKDLEEYKKLVDLELVGYGSYLTETADIFDLHVENYYNAEKILPSAQEAIINRSLGRKRSAMLSRKPRDLMQINSGSHDIDKLAIGNDKKEGSNVNALSNSFDLHGNLALGQLVAGMIFKNNKLFNESSYMTPEQERDLHVDALAQKILPSIELGEELFGTDDEEWSS